MADMKLKEYTMEELTNGIIVNVVVNNWTCPGQYLVNPVTIVKITPKRIVLVARRLQSHMSIEKFGVYQYSGIYCLEEDVKELVDLYVEKKSKQLNAQIESLQEEVNQLSNLTEAK